VLVDGGGRVSRAVPGDPELDGLRTTSLCQTDAERSFRVRVVGSAGVALALLASDGFANAQADDDWEGPVGRDIARMIAAEGIDEVASRLIEWVRRCASSEGSGDDTTIALVADPVTILVPGWEPELDRADDLRPLSHRGRAERPREARSAPDSNLGGPDCTSHSRGG
ncbi:MAG: hypothetical protein ACRDYC_04365, partial [Acidimicrobiales bacterium]